MTTSRSRSEQIAALNDDFRKHCRTPGIVAGKVVLTVGVNALGGDASTGRDPAAAFALLIDELLAGELEVDFSQTARKAYRTRLARMCSELADQAHRLKVSPATIARAQDMAAYLLAKK